MMPSIMSGSLIRDTPPWARMSAGTRSSAMTATAPASSAIFACSAVTTSMITPPLSISAMPRLTRAVPCTCSCDMSAILRGCATGARPVGRTDRQAMACPAARAGRDRGQERTGVVFVVRTTQVLPGFSGSALPAVVRRVVPESSLGRDQVPLIRLPCRNTETAPVPTV